MEADGTVDAQNAPTAPWKTLRVFHELPQGLSHRITHAKPRKAPKWRWEIRIDPINSGKYRIFTQWEVHIRPFDGAPAGTEGRIQISNAGGGFPVWGPDGRELFYMSGDDVVYAVDTTDLGAKGSVSLPSRLFQACPEGRPIQLATAGTPYATPYDTRDGERFLISCRAEPAGQFIVLLNWVLPE